MCYLTPGAHSIGDGYNIVRLGMADVMVCGSAEACLHPLAVAGFCQVGNLSHCYHPILLLYLGLFWYFGVIGCAIILGKYLSNT